MQKSRHLPPSKADSKARRAPAHYKKVKVDKARDHDWKQEATMMNLLGYHKFVE